MSRVIEEEDEMHLVAKALGSKTRWLIMKTLREDKLDVSRLAKAIGQTEANVSAQLKILEKAGLVKCHYVPGTHGVRKICDTSSEEIIFKLFKNEAGTMRR